MTNEERMLRERLGITDPLQVLPVDGSNIPTEKIQRSFLTKISDDFLTEIMKDRKLNTEQQQQVLNSVKNDKVTVIEGYPSINNSGGIKEITPPLNNSNDRKGSFSERFKDTQRRIQLEETHKVVSVNNPLVKLK